MLCSLLNLAPAPFSRKATKVGPSKNGDLISSLCASKLSSIYISTLICSSSTRMLVCLIISCILIPLTLPNSFLCHLYPTNSLLILEDLAKAFSSSKKPSAPILAKACLWLWVLIISVSPETTSSCGLGSLGLCGGSPPPFLFSSRIKYLLLDSEVGDDRQNHWHTFA